MSNESILPKRLAVPVTVIDSDGAERQESINIRPFTFGQLPAVTKHFAAIAGGLSIEQVSIPALVASGGEDILAIMGIATGKPRAWFDTLDPEGGVALVAAIVAVNKETFAKKLMPALAGLAATVTGQKSETTAA
jgi:hypothetical protein